MYSPCYHEDFSSTTTVARCKVRVTTRIFYLPLLLPDVMSMYTDMCLRLQDQVERARAQARVRKQEREDRELRQVGSSSNFFFFHLPPVVLCKIHVN